MKNKKSRSNLILVYSCCELLLGLPTLANQVTQENYLFGILENDLLIRADMEDPNSVVETETVELVTDSQPRTSLPSDQNDLEPPVLPWTSSQKDLWRAQISAAEGDNESRIKSELELMIRHINTIEIKPKQTSAPAEPVVDIVSPTEPNEPAAQDSITTQKEESIISDQVISEQTLGYFKKLSQDPNQLTNPLELGEILFNADCFEEAAVCYKEALKRQRPEQVDFAEDRAWVKLQLGDCLRQIDPDAACANYDSVISEFPNSPWALLAKAKSELLRWHAAEKPETLITKNVQSERPF